VERGRRVGQLRGVVPETHHSVSIVELDAARSLLDFRAQSRLNARMKTDREEPGSLLKSSAVADLCQVDLKTIHNWANSGEIRHSRTRGRHLRFSPADIVEFLRKYDYPVPQQFLADKPRVYLLDDDRSTLAAVKKTLIKQFEVTFFNDPVDALISIGVQPPAVIVLDVKIADFDGLHLLARLAQLPATRKIRKLVYSAAEHMRTRALDAGASAFVVKADVQKLQEALLTLAGA